MKEVLAQLSTYFGDEVLYPIEYYEKSWYGEPYIGGCFLNNPGIGNMRNYHEMRRPIGRYMYNNIR